MTRPKRPKTRGGTQSDKRRAASIVESALADDVDVAFDNATSDADLPPIPQRPDRRPSAAASPPSATRRPGRAATPLPRPGSIEIEIDTSSIERAESEEIGDDDIAGEEDVLARAPSASDPLGPVDAAVLDAALDFPVEEARTQPPRPPPKPGAAPSRSGPPPAPGSSQRSSAAGPAPIPSVRADGARSAPATSQVSSPARGDGARPADGPAAIRGPGPASAAVAGSTSDDVRAGGAISSSRPADAGTGSRPSSAAAGRGAAGASADGAMPGDAGRDAERGSRSSSAEAERGAAGARSAARADAERGASGSMPSRDAGAMSERGAAGAMPAARGDAERGAGGSMPSRDAGAMSERGGAGARSAARADAERGAGGSMPSRDAGASERPDGSSSPKRPGDVPGAARGSPAESDGRVVLPTSRPETFGPYAEFGLSSDPAELSVKQRVPLPPAWEDDLDEPPDDDGEDQETREPQIDEAPGAASGGPDDEPDDEQAPLPALAIAVYDSGALVRSAERVIAEAGHAVVVAGSGPSGLDRVATAVRAGVDALFVAIPGGESLIDIAYAAEHRPVIIASVAGEPDEAVYRAIEVGADLVALRPHELVHVAPVLLAAVRLANPADDDEAPLGTLQPYDDFERAFAQQLERTRRHSYALTLVLFEVVSASALPPGVPNLLRARAGNALMHVLRDIDVATELERSRFLVLMPYTTAANAAGVARRMIAAVNTADPIVMGNRTFAPKVIGALAGFEGTPTTSTTLDDLIQEASEALEQARRDGAELAVRP